MKMYVYKTKAGLEICRSDSRIIFTKHFPFLREACLLIEEKKKRQTKKKAQNDKEVNDVNK